MTSRDIRHLWGVSLLAMSIFACGEDLPVVARGRYVELATDRDDPVCAGTVAHLDRFIEGVFAAIGESPPDRVFARVEWPAHHDGTASAGIDGDRVFARSPLLVHEHELMHVAHLQAWPRSARFMEEGLAVMVDPHRRDFPVWEVSASMLDAVLEDQVLEGGRYAVAWFIVSQIVHDHGMEGLRELWHRIPARASTQRVRDAYFEVFGRSIDALIEPLIMEGPDGPVPVPRVPCSYTVCTGEAHPWQGDRWIAEAPSGCEDDPNAVGADAQAYDAVVGPVWRDYLLENTTPLEPPQLSDQVTAIAMRCGLQCPYEGAGPILPESASLGGRLRVEVRTTLESLPTDTSGTLELRHATYP
jgi:hypothetical protein